MSDIVDKIKNIPGLLRHEGCVTSQIREAQKELDIEFPSEFVEYVKAYGYISFYGTEWTGLNATGDRNVVTVTKLERELNSSFPNDSFVIEDTGIDGLLAIMGADGKVYAYKEGTIEPLCNSLSEYLDICLARKED